MWSEQRKNGDDQMTNGANIKPVYTFSSYNYWIKRNLIMINDGI